MTLRKKIFLFYLVLIPFSIPSFLEGILPLNTYLVSIAIFPFFLAFLAYFVHSIKNSVPLNKFWLHSFFVVVFLGFYSSIMGAIHYTDYGTMFGEDSISATISFFMYPIFAWLIIWVNYNGFIDIGLERIKRVLLFWSISFILISLLQLVVLNVPSFAKVYDGFNFLGFFRDSNYILKEGRICGYLKEPSIVGNFTVCLLLPYSFYESFYCRKKKYFILFLMILLVSILSFSSATYVALIVFFIFIVAYFVKKNRKDAKTLLTSIFIAISVFGILISFNYSDFQRLLFKITDLSNMSTAYRYSIIYNDLMIFKDNPFGIGNGNQGFFYNNVAQYFYNQSQSPEILYAINGGYGLIGGGPFFGSLISGYGIVGIVAFIVIYGKMLTIGKKIKYTFPKYLFFSSIMIFSVMGIVSVNINLDFVFPFIIGLLAFENNYQQEDKMNAIM